MPRRSTRPRPHLSAAVALSLAAVLPLPAPAGQAGSEPADAAPGGEGPTVSGPRGRALDELVTRCERLGFSGAVLLEEGGEVLLAKGYGLADRAAGRPNTADTRFDVGALAQTFTAAAVLLLAERGTLSTADALERHLADLPADKRAITLEELLRHTAGLAPGPAPAGGAPGEALARALATPLVARPGERVLFSGAGYVLLAAVVEAASGEPFEELVAREVFRPAGMRSTVFDGGAALDPATRATGYAGGRAVDPSERPARGAGAVLSTVRDLGAWERALRAHAVLPAAAAARLLAPDAELAGWRTTLTRGGRLAQEHGGATPGFLARMVRWPGAGDEPPACLVWLANDAAVGTFLPVTLASALLGEEHAAPPPVVAVDTERLAAHAGPWRTATGGRVSVRVADGRLELLPLDQDTAAAFHAPPPFTPPVADALGTSRTAQRLVEALEAGDAAALERLLAPRFPGGPAGLLADWREGLAERGGLERWRVVATLPGRVGAQAFVLLETGAGPRFLRTEWRAERLQRLALDAPFPAVCTATPLDPDTFAVFDLATMTDRGRLAFDGAGGATLELDGGRTELRRAD